MSGQLVSGKEVRSGHHMLLAEFDYSMTPKPSIPFINTIQERRAMW